MAEVTANKFKAYLQSAVDADDNIFVLDVVPPVALRTGSWRAKIDNEIVKVTYVDVDAVSITVERGSEGSTNTSHEAGRPIINILTAESLNTVVSEAITAHNHDSDYDAAGTAQQLVEDHEAHDIVAFSGFYDTIIANQISSQQMVRAGIRKIVSIVMTNPGYISGISAVSEKTISSGSVTFSVCKNNSPGILNTTLSTDASSWNSPGNTFGNPTYAFVAGDKIDAHWTSTSDLTWAGGGNSECEVTIEVVYEDES